MPEQPQPDGSRSPGRARRCWEWWKRRDTHGIATETAANFAVGRLFSGVGAFVKAFFG